MVINAFGEQKTLSSWADDPRCPVSAGVLRNRLGDGWNAEKAITTPFRGPAWHATKRGTLEEDRARPAERTVTYDVPEPPRSKRPKVTGQLKQVPVPPASTAWRGALPKETPPVQGRSSSVRTVRGGLPSLGKRRR